MLSFGGLPDIHPRTGIGSHIAAGTLYRCFAFPRHHCTRKVRKAVVNLQFLKAMAAPSHRSYFFGVHHFSLYFCGNCCIQIPTTLCIMLPPVTFPERSTDDVCAIHTAGPQGGLIGFEQNAV